MTDPIRLYEINGEVCTVQCATLAAPLALNQTLVPAVTGKRIRVMGWIAQSGGAVVGAFGLKNGATGAYIMFLKRVPAITDGLIEKLPIVDCGYMETSTGTALGLDVTDAAVNLTVFYIEYTP
jgi:hypothetical protein